MYPSPKPNLLELRGLGRLAVDGRWLLKDIELMLQAGQRLAVAGPTGAGKTLLLRAIARLDPIDQGELRWRGKSVFGKAVPLYRRQAIYLHQRPSLVEGTVEDNIRLPFGFRSQRGKTYSRAGVLDCLAAVSRDETFLSRSSRDLSGGEMQIVALLRAIQLQPDLLLLDEPTAALDEAATLLIEGLVDRWWRDAAEHAALIWVSHNRDQIRRIADSVLQMREGRIAAIELHAAEMQS